MGAPRRPPKSGARLPPLLPAPLRHTHAADGTRLAFREVGSGPPVVLVNGLSTSDFSWCHLEPRWARRHRLVLWDYKGHGLSDPARSDEGCTIPAMADDLRRVMDAAGVERAPLVGFSMGCQVVLEAWRQMPERIAGMACLLGPAGRLFDTALRPVAGPAVQRLLRMPARWLPPTFSVAHRVARLPGSRRMGRLLRLYGGASRTDIRRYIDHFAQLDPHTVARIALASGEHDARDVLRSISVPTLVAVGTRDIFAPPKKVGLPMHAQIPNARLLRIPGGSHLGILENADLIGPAVDELLLDAL